jgi:hypothetical protein
MPDSPSAITSNDRAANLNENSPVGNGINTPDLSAKTMKPGRRAITDVNHVFLIIGNLLMARRSQSYKNGRIAAKLNAERPLDDEKLQSEGLGYKSNFSTKPLSVTISKVAGRLVKAIQSARYLTAAQLPDTIDGGKEKSELFRSEITNLIRRWDGWFDFISLLAAEDSTYGWVAAAWLDNQSWKPVAKRQDDYYVPDGTGHSVDTVQVACMRRFVQMHELAEMILDKDSAKKAGWDIENTVESINNARPPTIPAGFNAPYSDQRRYEDAIRESTVSLTLANGAKQIEIWDVFATEIDGKISHYIADNNTRKLLFEKEDRYPNASDCLAQLSYEYANGKLMGSKGVGREIYEIAGALDRARNEVIDRLQMSGKIILSGPQAMIDRFILNVVGNVCIIPEGFTIHQNKIETSIEDFIQLDQLLTQLLDQIAGSVSPKQLPGERVTAAQVNLFAEREEEKRDDRDTRFIMQLATGVIWTMTRRAMSSQCTDDDAKRVKEKLLSSMSQDELDMLVETPSLRTIEDFTELDAQKIIAFASEKRQDPMYDQHKLQKQAASVLISTEFANDVLLPENDPTVTAEQTRLQEMENMLMDAGKPSSVSPRDNHNDHIAVLKNSLVPVMQAGVKGDLNALNIAGIYLQHWADHLSAAEAAGVDKKSLAPSEKELQSVAKQLGELQAHAQASLQAQAQGLPPPPPQMPGGSTSAPPPGAAPATSGAPPEMSAAPQEAPEAAPVAA